MKGAKKYIIISLIIVCVGLAITLTAFALGGRFSKLETKSVTRAANGEFTKIEIKSYAADIVIEKSETEKCYAVCNENERVSFALNVEDGKLTLTEVDNRRWFEFIGFGDDTKAVLYLPEGIYNEISCDISSGEIVCEDSALTFGKADLSTSSGDIYFSSGLTGVINVSSSSGDVHISDISPSTLTVDCTSGETELKNVIASGKINIQSSSGSILLRGCDAGELTLRSSSGNIYGTLLTDKLFDAKSSSGSVDCPASIKNGGKCTVKTSSGNIKISIAE